ncbi:MAG: hypothetical protein NC114_06285 [Ruminococcus flavefaciens]|nr:hypothetical protein [Ruminococcus flavefaciens]
MSNVSISEFEGLASGPLDMSRTLHDWLNAIHDPELDKVVCKSLANVIEHQRIRRSYKQFVDKLNVTNGMRVNAELPLAPLFYYHGRPVFC